jgi:hypothetical protein
MTTQFDPLGSHYAMHGGDAGTMVPLSRVLIETAFILIPDVTLEVAVTKLLTLARKLDVPVDDGWLENWCRELCTEVWQMTA